MTKLAEFKEIESLADLLEAISEGEKWGTLTRDEVKTVLKAARSLPALIAVAEGMAEALCSGQVLSADVHNRLIGQGIDPDVCRWFVVCRENIKQALAAFEAWKGKIEGEG